MSVLKAVREALRAELASWSLGITGITWRGDLHAPKTDAADDQPDDSGLATPMAGISLPRYTLQEEAEPVVVAHATTTRGAVLSSGDAEASCEVAFYVSTLADYDTVIAEFDRWWRWKAYDSSDAGSSLAIATTLLGVSSEVRANLGPQVTPAAASLVSARELLIVAFEVRLRFPDLHEEITGEEHGRQYVRVSVNDGPTIGPAEAAYLQLEQDETDHEHEDGTSKEVLAGA